MNAAGYLTFFVAGFSAAAAPLYALYGEEKGGWVTLDKSQIASCNSINLVMSSLLILKPLGFNKIVIIDSNANKKATVGVLLQPHSYSGNIRNDDKFIRQDHQTVLFPITCSDKFTPTK